MNQIITQDNAPTFFSEKYQETYHSITGAIEEARKKFVEPAKHKKNPKILDICFGVGYNSAAALDVFEDCTIIGLENDQEIIKIISKIQPEFKQYDEIKKASENKSKKIRIIVGDAREEIKKLPDNYFDIVFLDPFSPKKCPELWTEEFLTEVYKKTAPEGILTTYSCARIIRENLKKAGFEVRDGPKVGRRAPATIASKTFK